MQTIRENGLKPRTGTSKERLENNVFPWLGERPIAEITARELLAVFNKTVERGRIDTAQRLRADCGRVFSYAVATGRAERNPIADLAGALPSAKTQHRATIIEPKQVAELLRAIDAYTGTFVVRAAFKLAPLLFLRPGELVQAEWAEFDLEAGEWRIPGERMKMGGGTLSPCRAKPWRYCGNFKPSQARGGMCSPACVTRKYT